MYVVRWQCCTIDRSYIGKDNIYMAQYLWDMSSQLPLKVTVSMKYWSLLTIPIIPAIVVVYQSITCTLLFTVSTMNIIIYYIFWSKWG